MEDNAARNDETIKMSPANSAAERTQAMPAADDATQVIGTSCPAAGADAGATQAIGGPEDQTLCIPVITPEEAAGTGMGDEPDPFAPREPLGATGPLPAAEQAAASHDVEPLPERHTLRNIALGMLLAVVVVLGGFAGWLAWDDSRNASCHVPANVTLDGESISGFTAAEVRSVVNRHIIAGTAGSAVLVVSEEQVVGLEYPKLGDVNVDATVSAAMATIEPDMLRRCANRALGLVGMAPEPEPRALITVCALSEDRVRSKVSSIASDFDVAVRDAASRSTSTPPPAPSSRPRKAARPKSMP